MANFTIEKNVDPKNLYDINVARLQNLKTCHFVKVYENFRIFEILFRALIVITERRVSLKCPTLQLAIRKRLSLFSTPRAITTAPLLKTARSQKLYFSMPQTKNKNLSHHQDSDLKLQKSQFSRFFSGTNAKTVSVDFQRNGNFFCMYKVISRWIKFYVQTRKSDIFQNTIFRIYIFDTLIYKCIKVKKKTLRNARFVYFSILFAKAGARKSSNIDLLHRNSWYLNHFVTY